MGRRTRVGEGRCMVYSCNQQDSFVASFCPAPSLPHPSTAASDITLTPLHLTPTPNLLPAHLTICAAGRAAV